MLSHNVYRRLDWVVGEVVGGEAEQKQTHVEIEINFASERYFPQTGERQYEQMSEERAKGARVMHCERTK